MAALSIRERAIRDILAALQAITDPPGLTVRRDDDTEYDAFPALNVLDADAPQRLDKRTSDSKWYEIDLPIEGAVSADTPGRGGEDLSALYAATVQALNHAEAASEVIFEIVEADMDAELVRGEAGVAPYAVFALSVTVTFATADTSPYSLPS